MKKVRFLSNDYCFAVYVDGDLIVWGEHGDDHVLHLKRVGEKLGFEVSWGTLPELNGEAPAERESDYGNAG